MSYSVAVWPSTARCASERASDDSAVKSRSQVTSPLSNCGMGSCSSLAAERSGMYETTEYVWPARRTSGVWKVP